MDLEAIRRLVAMDAHDPLSRFALGQKLFRDGDGDADLRESVEHLRIAHERDPSHLATYHVLAQALLRLGRREEARAVLEAGIRKAGESGALLGADLGPVMVAMLAELAGGEGR